MDPIGGLITVVGVTIGTLIGGLRRRETPHEIVVTVGLAVASGLFAFTLWFPVAGALGEPAGSVLRIGFASVCLVGFLVWVVRRLLSTS